jgi:hypothetical protein
MLPLPCWHADEDGYITFEEFMVSYARPKPILKNLLIMVINTAVIYFILQAPFLDTMIKVRLAAHEVGIRGDFLIK